MLVSNAVRLQRWKSMSSWLSRHGLLLGSVHLQLQTAAQEAAVIAALESASKAVVGSLPVRHFAQQIVNGVACSAMQRIEHNSLTKLTLTTLPKAAEAEDTTAGTAAAQSQLLGAVRSAVEPCTNLQSLLLHLQHETSNATGHVLQEDLLRGVGGLQHLTTVQLAPVASALDMQHLPAQLQHCSVELSCDETACVQLRHLTA